MERLLSPKFEPQYEVLPDADIDYGPHNEAVTCLTEKLAERWKCVTCPECNESFYKKSSNSTPVCGAYDCEGGYSFIESKPSRNRSIDLLGVSGHFRDFFESAGYVPIGPIPLVGHAKNSVFAGTAGQVFDEAIFNEAPYDRTEHFVRQPVVRMHPQPYDGFTNSFVNISLEQLDSSPTGHFKHFESYIDFLSSVGIYAGDLTIKTYKDVANWGRGEFPSAVMGVYYGGLEMGVLNYFTNIRQSTRSPLSMSDVSFGLERVAWALNRSPRFIDISAPPLEIVRQAPHELLDGYRTITLMMQSGIRLDGQSQASGKLKRLFKDTICPVSPLRKDLIEYYAEWWATFNTTCVPVPSDVITTLAEAQQARLLCDTLGTKYSSLDVRNTNVLIEDMVAKGIVKTKDLGRLYYG